MTTFKSRTIVRRIGQKAWTFRIPVIVADEVSYIHPDTFLGRWLVLSFIAAVEHFEVQLWNQQGQELAQRDTALLLVPTEPTILDWSKPLIQKQTHYTVACDPLHRLQRLYGGRAEKAPGKGRTFVIDPRGALQFHLHHSVNGQGMSVLTEVLQVYQDIAAHGLPTIARSRHTLHETPTEGSMNSSDGLEFSLAI